MSKELEALQIIVDDFRDNPYSSEERDNAIVVIIKAIKENEYLKTELLGLSQELNIKNKALEVIKKLLIIDDDKQRIDVKNCVEMSDDEYDLLKEILL